jgi:DNA-directed RNA polymerase beta' subunit
MQILKYNQMLINPPIKGKEGIIKNMILGKRVNFKPK